VKSSKAHTHAKFHKIPRLRFDSEKKLTSYAGIVVFQALFIALQLRSQLILVNINPAAPLRNMLKTSPDAAFADQAERRLDT